MDALLHERRLRRALAPRALIAGFAVGAVAFAATSLVLFRVDGLRVGATGVVTTLLVALAVGMWSGAPLGDDPAQTLRERWILAGLATALAGAFATVWGLFPWLGEGTAGRAAALLVLLALPSYVLGMLLPALASAGEAWEDEEEGSAWGALGVVVTGLLAGAAVGVLAAGLVLLPAVGAGPMLIGVSVVVLVPLLLPEPADEGAREDVLYEVDTPFSALRVTEVVFAGERQPERRLYQNGEEESGELARSGAPTLGYIAAAERWLQETTPRGSTYLFLGGGAYTLPRRIAEADAASEVTVVELDPAVTAAAYRFFGVRPEHAIRTVNGDARAFLERGGTGQEYDRIFVDVYAGQEALPYSLVTRDAFEAVASRLRQGGRAGLNVIGVLDGPEALRFWSVVRTFAEVFPSAALYTHLGPDFPDRQNLLLVGAREDDAGFPARAGHFERLPREEWPDLDSALVLRDLFAAPESATAIPPGLRTDSVHGARGDRAARG